MLLKPYISLDIETTGLNLYTSQILEIGAVFDDGISHITDLKTFRAITTKEIITGDPYALYMNSELLKEIASKKSINKSDNLIKDFTIWLSNIFKGQPVTFAGKNISGFDVPFLKKEGFLYPYSHRMIDVGSLYFSEFGYIPSLSDVNTLLGYKPVAHKALDDALNGVYAIRQSVLRGS